MSSGSYFLMLRTSKSIENEIVDKKEIQSYIDDFNKKYTCIGFQSDTFEDKEFYAYPLTLEHNEINNYKWVSFKTGKIYDEIFCLNFLSDFAQLKEEYALDPFRNSEMKISFGQAKEMLVAINYLLSRNFSLKTEDILNNHYIRVFGEMLPSYEAFLNGKRFYENNDLDENESRYVLNKLQSLFNIYIWMENENSLNECEYILLYHVW